MFVGQTGHKSHYSYRSSRVLPRSSPRTVIVRHPLASLPHRSRVLSSPHPRPLTHTARIRYPTPSFSARTPATFSVVIRHHPIHISWHCTLQVVGPPRPSTSSRHPSSESQPRKPHSPPTARRAPRALTVPLALLTAFLDTWRAPHPSSPTLLLLRLRESLLLLPFNNTNPPGCSPAPNKPPSPWSS